MNRKWRRCQCTIHSCVYRAQPDNDFCRSCDLDRPYYCAAMAEYQRMQKQKKSPAAKH